MRWKAEIVPRYTLSIKYLRMMMSAEERDKLIERYVEVKRRYLTGLPVGQTGNTHKKKPPRKTCLQQTGMTF